MAEPWLRIINPPNKTKTNKIGNNQYFFLTFKNLKNSNIKFIINKHIQGSDTYLLVLLDINSIIIILINSVIYSFIKII